MVTLWGCRQHGATGSTGGGWGVGGGTVARGDETRGKREKSGGYLKGSVPV